MLKHKAGVENRASDALGHWIEIITIVSAKVVGFEWLRNDYESCLDFKNIFKTLTYELVREQNDYFLQDMYLFRAN